MKHFSFILAVIKVCPVLDSSLKKKKKKCTPNHEDHTFLWKLFPALTGQSLLAEALPDILQKTKENFTKWTLPYKNIESFMIKIIIIPIFQY